MARGGTATTTGAGATRGGSVATVAAAKIVKAKDSEGREVANLLAVVNPSVNGKRRDQLDCPYLDCGATGCPCSGGSHTRQKLGIYRMRQCRGCKRYFKTLERFIPGTGTPSGVEEVRP